MAELVRPSHRHARGHGGYIAAFGGLLGGVPIVVWLRNVTSDTGAEVPYGGFASSPLVVDDIVVVGAAGQLAAYDIATGDLRWLGPEGGDSASGSTGTPSSSVTRRG